MAHALNLSPWEGDRWLLRTMASSSSGSLSPAPWAMTNEAVGSAMTDTVRRKQRRGFASMSSEKQREIASKGGRAAHLKGTAHRWTSEEARHAGRKGGLISRGGRGRLELETAVPAEG